MESLEFSNWGNDLFFYRKGDCVICNRSFSYIPYAVHSLMETKPVWRAYLSCIRELFGESQSRWNDLQKARIGIDRNSRLSRNYHLECIFEFQLPCWDCFSLHRKWFEEICFDIDIEDFGAEKGSFENWRRKIESLSQQLLTQILKNARGHFKDRVAKKELGPRHPHRTITRDQFSQMLIEIKKYLSTYPPSIGNRDGNPREFSIYELLNGEEYAAVPIHFEVDKRVKRLLGLGKAKLICQTKEIQ